MMSRLVVRLAINGVALWGAAALVPGMELSQSYWGVLVVAAVFGLVNTFVKPPVTFLSIPLLLLTFGLFMLVINALMLLVTAWITRHLSVAGFGSAFVGALVISVVSFLLTVFLGEREAED